MGNEGGRPREEELRGKKQERNDLNRQRGRRKIKFFFWKGRKIVESASITKKRLNQTLKVWSANFEEGVRKEARKQETMEKKGVASGGQGKRSRKVQKGGKDGGTAPQGRILRHNGEDMKMKGRLKEWTSEGIQTGRTTMNGKMEKGTTVNVHEKGFGGQQEEQVESQRIS